MASPGQDEEVEGWGEVLGIQERYQNKCSSKNDGKYWLVQMLEEFKDGKASAKYLAKINRQVQIHPWAEINLSRLPFSMPALLPALYADLDLKSQ